MSKVISNVAWLTLVAALTAGSTWGRSTIARGPCRYVTGNSPVAQACRRGGRPEAKKVMTTMVKAAKTNGGKFVCDQCHRYMEADDFHLKRNAREKFKKLLELARMEPSSPSASR
jgi:hypothetical protein